MFDHTTRGWEHPSPANLRSWDLIVFLTADCFPIYYYAFLQVVDLHSCTVTTATSKKSFFIRSKRSDFHRIENLSIALHAFCIFLLTSLSVNEILLLKYLNSFTNFTRIQLKVETAPFILNRWTVFWIHIEANASCCCSRLWS